MTHSLLRQCYLLASQPPPRLWSPPRVTPSPTKSLLSVGCCTHPPVNFSQGQKPPQNKVFSGLIMRKPQNPFRPKFHSGKSTRDFLQCPFVSISRCSHSFPHNVPQDRKYLLLVQKINKPHRPHKASEAGIKLQIGPRNLARLRIETYSPVLTPRAETEILSISAQG